MIEVFIVFIPSDTSKRNFSYDQNTFLHILFLAFNFSLASNALLSIQNLDVSEPKLDLRIRI